MNFQSVFSDDPGPESQTPGNLPENLNPGITSITSAWTFGSSLMKTLASKSESVIETYRRDLDEFTSGIKKETAVIREAAAKAVKELPTSLEAGATLAQESLESVGQAVEDLGTTVTEIIAHGKDSVLAVDYSDSDSDVSDGNISRRISKPYSRLDAQIRMIQSDMNTYLKESEDLGFNEWKLGFNFDEKVGEIDEIMNDKDVVVGEIYREIVPSRVDEKSFWIRYFFRVYKVRKAEEARVEFVKRAIAGEEELTWDVEEDDYEENAESDFKDEEKEYEDKTKKKDGVFETKNEDQNEAEDDKLEAKSDVKTDGDISILSSQTSPDEDGWDEIEDIGSSDENKDRTASHGNHGRSDRAELRKRLSVAEEEDLTWDIEDDDDDDEVVRA